MKIMALLELGDVDLYYEETGAGKETIVFSHGFLWSCRMFDKQVEALKDKYRIIAFDHRGQGKSSIPKDGYDIDNVTNDAIKLIEKLNTEPVHFVGLSMGGFVGMRIAKRRPDLIKSLILIGTSASAEAKENISGYKRLGFIARWISLRLVAKPAMKVMFGETFLSDKLRKDEYNYRKKQMLGNDRKGITRALSGVLYRDSFEDNLLTISCPVLILIGDEDVALPPEKSELMHSLINDSQLVVVPQAGHTSTVEQPERVNQEISSFLSALL
jgi:pimeloyl-ACP methyl ester carboxylesterase